MPINRERLKILRLDRGITQAELAKRAGMGQPALARIESGRRPNPALSTVERIAAALGVGVEAIVAPPDRS